jgi:phytoene synthase
MSDEALARSREFCREVTRRRARNFYYGMKLTPEPKRSAMYAIYAWMRHADDLADESGAGSAKVHSLEQLRCDTEAALDGESMPEGKVWPTFVETVHRYRIPRTYLHEMIDGQILDQQQTRYARFAELYDYCYKVASTVGLTCIEIWGYEGGEQTRRLAEWRGVAFQLTNILRDVLEDAQRDRVYLPAEDFEAMTLSPLMFTMDRSGDALSGIRRMVGRAADYYRRSRPLDQHVHRDGRACLWAMTRIYHGLLTKIAANPSRVLGDGRVRLSSLRKGMIAVSASWRAGMAR